MGKILQGRYDRFLRRITAQVGFGSKVGEALEDLFPVLDVESGPIEILRASGWHFGMGRISNTSAAATTATHQLFNPVGSSQLIVVTNIKITLGAAGAIVYGPSFAALTDTSVAGAERDTRRGAISPTIGLLQEEDDGAASNFGRFNLRTVIMDEMADQNGLCVLAPGTGFRLSTVSDEQNMTTAWMWRERVAEPEELNF